MIYRNLLLIVMISASCGTLPSHDNGLFYQAEELENVTIEWRFALKTGIKVSSIKIHCVQLPGLKVFYELDSSVVEAQHEQFVGRVRCDKEALRSGRVRLHLARARTEDSAGYLCRMATGHGRRVKEFTLDITPRELAPEDPVVTTEEPKATTRGRIGLCVGLGLFTATSAFLAYSASFIKHYTSGCLK